MTKSRSRRRSGKSRTVSAPRRGWWRWMLLLGLLLLAVMGAYAAWLDHTVRSQFEGKRWSVPATVYARALELHQGQRLTRRQLELELEALGYSQGADTRQPGTWRASGSGIELSSRPFTHWDGHEPSQRLHLTFADGRINMLRRLDGSAVSLARLDPAVIGHIYPGHREDRLLVRLEDVPPTLIAGLVVVEDRAFFQHAGISPSAIARAAAANLRAGRVVQGGSTITQQLVKNFYLSSDRTFWRKGNEAIMALLLEARYDKEDILETYLNEVYLAQDGDRAIHGFGLASQHFFGTELARLSLEQQALLIALVRGPSFYHPRRHEQRALARRNLVLDLMSEQGVISRDAARVASSRPRGLRPARTGPRASYPAFMDLVQRHLLRDYQREDLQTEGLRIFTTFAPSVQHATEAAIQERLRDQPVDVEAAAVIVDVDSGEVMALVGGRNPRYAGFNRALDARRPVGSLIKPAVYLAALDQPARYGLGSLLEDVPLTVTDERGRPWEPRNFDRTFRGQVSLVDALAYSYNIPTIRLGQEIGLSTVGRTVERLGAPTPRTLYPSYLIGTGELTPLQVAQVYQTLASGGYRSPLRAVREVTGQDGTPLSRYSLAVDRVFDPASVQLVNLALVEATRRGTGRDIYRYLPSGLTMAGKTGTTDETRDSWFAGFGADRLGVVWLGRDDNAPTGFTGSSGALPIWGVAMAAIEPAPYADVLAPELEWVWIDGESGARSAEGCEGARRLAYRVDAAPEEWTACGQRVAQREEGGGLGGWIRGLWR
ncbi:MAG: penicillin-binding protein 1B [Ectothiorhodospiraceae bacterium]|nr:penicillin-binding protein 1B [Ectothiorhodospiraceae bacterium]